MKILGLSVTNIIAVLMFALFLITSIRNNKLAIDNTGINRVLCLVVFWVVFSTFLNMIITTVPNDVKGYTWAVGLNSPQVRGISFTIRLFLSLFTIMYITSKINDIKNYFKIINIFIAAYGIFCLFPILQAILYFGARIEIGQIFLGPGFRVGAYVGEPSILASIIISGYVLLIYSIKNKEWNKYFTLPKKIRVLILVIATIDLLLAFSASLILAVLITLFIYSNKYIKRKYKIGIIVIIFLGFMFSTSVKMNFVMKVLNELSTINIRTLSWVIGIRTFASNWLLGVGIGRAPFYVGKYFPFDLNIPFDYRTYYDYTSLRHPPMNSYLEWITENGLVGVILLIALFVRIFELRKKQKKDNILYKFVNSAFGMTLMIYAISINSYPGAFYMAHLNLILILYISGLKIAYRSQFDIPKLENHNMKLDKSGGVINENRH
ncbi:MAG: O-antigen ligase family protein [Ruminiclostridium sp.]